MGHLPVFTVEESRDLKKAIAGGQSKNLFLKDKKGQMALVVSCADRVLDLKKLSAAIGLGRVSFARVRTHKSICCRCHGEFQDQGSF